MAERQPHYYSERGPRSAGRSPSVAPGHEGQYVSRREHQREIGRPLGWQRRETTSQKGVMRTQWQRGTLEHPVTPREVLTMLEGAVKQARDRIGGVDQVLFLVQVLRSSGEVQFAGGIYARGELGERMQQLVARKETLLDWVQGENDILRWNYGPEATGAVQLMVW